MKETSWKTVIICTVFFACCTICFCSMVSCAMNERGAAMRERLELKGTR